MPEHPVADNSTYGNFEQISSKHVHMNVDVDLDSRVISGTVTHDLDCVADTRVLQFDAWDLTVTSVKLATTGSAKAMRDHGPDARKSTAHLANGEELPWHIGEYNAIIGQTLIIDLTRIVAAGE